MNLYEFQAADLFRRYGIPVCEGVVAQTADEAVQAATRLGYPVVLKAQVLTGGRGKAGGVVKVGDETALRREFDRIRSLTIKGYPVRRVYVVKALAIAKEMYASVVLDAPRDQAVLIFSAAGGVDIEEIARTQPEAVSRQPLSLSQPGEGVEALLARSPIEETAHLAPILHRLVDVFVKEDALLAEINPLVVTTQGVWVAADAKVSIDDNALFRHPETASWKLPEDQDPQEAKAREAGLSFVTLDGEVGCMVNGAGLAMATMDAITLYGGRPANFLDVGGSSSPRKVVAAFEIILNHPKVKSILVNIFGGITRCDDIAQGLIEARRSLGVRLPCVVRLTGTNEDRARSLLQAEGITAHTRMRDAVQEAVRLARGTGVTRDPGQQESGGPQGVDADGCPHQ